MKPKNLQIGDLVWAKMRGYPPWPAKIEEPPNESKTPTKLKKHHYYVLFFGSENYAWIPDEGISYHSDAMVEGTRLKKKSAQFQKAIDCIVQLSKTQTKRDQQREVEKPEENDVPTPSCSYSKSPTSLPKNKTIAPSSKSLQQSSEQSSEKAIPKKIFSKTPPKTSRKRSVENADLSVKVPSRFPSTKKRQKLKETAQTEDFSLHTASISDIPSPIPSDDEDPLISSQSTYLERPVTPELNLAMAHNNLESKKIKVTDKKIGFLGLGIMGRGIVMNLLKSGHDVMVWNRTMSRCEPFVSAGAKRGQSPADVVSKCDITLCCISDPEAVKETVFGKDGVIKGFDPSESGKGYVEMTTIDVATSKLVSEAITMRGGRYLGAFINGSKKLSEDGMLLLMVSGDRSLYDDCHSCFEAISKKARYLDSEVGTATKMNLVLSMFQGTVCGALAEAMALVDRVNLSQNDFMDIVALNPFKCYTIMEKGHAIHKKDFTTSTPLKHAQAALSMALKLSREFEQPLSVASRANELFKKTKFMNYGNHDMSSVYMGVKH